MTKIPMLIIDKLEVRKREFFLDKGRKFVKNRLCPMAYKNNELINVPSDASSWHLGIVTLKLGIFMSGLGLKVFFHPYLPVQMRIVDKGKALVGCFFNHFRRYLLLADTKERFVLRVIPKNTDARHLFVESLHISHLHLMFFVCKLSHNIPFACKINTFS